jgi:hypothetical protein
VIALKAWWAFWGLVCLVLLAVAVHDHSVRLERLEKKAGIFQEAK